MNNSTALKFEQITEEQIDIYDSDNNCFAHLIWQDGRYILESENYFFLPELKEIIAYMEKLNEN